MWFLKGGLPLVVIAKSDLIDLRQCDYVTACGTLFINRYMADGEIFAPSATDIMQDLPGWNLSRNMSAWECWMDFNDENGYNPKVCTHENPTEAAAQAWFFDNKHKP